MVDFEAIEAGDLRVRKLTDTPQDVAVMARWLTDPRVLEFYEGRDNPFDEAGVRTKFIGKLKEEETPCIVELQGRPVGYLQFYPLPADEARYLGYMEGERVFGTDQFIGEPELWGAGIGTRMLRLVISYLFDVEKAERVVMDPHALNVRAIRAYEKCGLRRVRVLPDHELHEGERRDSWLMEVTPGTFRRE